MPLSLKNGLFVVCLLTATELVGCVPPTEKVAVQASEDLESNAADARDKAPSVVTPEQEKEIRGLIDLLIFDSDPDVEVNRKRREACERAYEKLFEFKGLAIPFMVEHLNDDRHSIPFRNHFAGSSVGNACFWNIYFQLQDQPADYSEYGYSRKGSDGKNHPKPYWKARPSTTQVDSSSGWKKTRN
jgi:hypothetical protein